MVDNEWKYHQVDCLFLLIGENPLPNYVAAMKLLKEGGTAYLVYTTQTQPHKERLKIALKAKGFKNKEVNLEGNKSNAYLIYQKLFDGDKWETGEFVIEEEETKCVREFEKFMLAPETGISKEDYPSNGKPTHLREIPRIEMLLAMLQCDNETPDSKRTEYMNLDSFKNRPVLPTPLQVMGIEDRRQVISKSSPIKKQSQEKNRGNGNSHVFQRPPKPR